jgi:ribose transport system permease protein
LYGIPTSLLLVAGAFLVILVPFRRTNLGRGIYAVGSSEGAAYMSGLDVNLTKMAAYTLAGLLASFGGLFIGLQTLTGDAMTGPSYTLISIASVVLGGTSLSGGIGGALEAIIGAFTLRTINSMMFFAGAPPLAQPLFEGLILMAALSLGGLRLIGMRNRLDLWQ